MAPPVGTLRVGRYFTALALLFAVLYLVVGLSEKRTPKLGLDLVGGIRVVFTAVTPQGSPPPTSDQMTQARQILEDRINGTGVTGSTVVVQGSDQLVVEIPSGTDSDIETLGQAAILNFRGLVASAQAVSCGQSATPTPSTSGSGSTSPGTGASSGGATSQPSGSTSTSPSDSASRAPDAAGERPLAAPSSGVSVASSSASTGSSASPGASAGTSPAGSGATSPAGSGASTSPAASPTTPAAATGPCLSNPFDPTSSADKRNAPAALKALKSELVKTYKITAKSPLIWDVLPNAETCPSPGIDNSECRGYDKLDSTETAAITTALQSLKCNATQTEPDRVNGAYFACDDGTTYGTKANPAYAAYLLGHVVVQGKQIDSASAQAPNIANGGSAQWTVLLNLTTSGGDRWHAWTSKYNNGGSTTSAQSPTSCGGSTGVPCSDFVGFTLDGQVISAPVTQGALGKNNTQISGNFQQPEATDLARQLNYGKLPVNFRADATETVSATLGNKQLKAAFLAGGIGLALVVLYSLIYYRALGVVTIASLLVSAGLTYAFLVILGKQLGFTLDLAGIAGFIVALGITADSFVVFFERLKDEVHEGRSARVAVPRAWVRARRTILSADTVSFLAAAILYYFAAADVKGFAFTLGMSTILDLIVVFLFTHPLVALLSRSAAFGSSRMTGLDAVRGTRTPIEPTGTARDRAAARRTDDTDPAGDAEPASDRFRGVAVMSKPDPEKAAPSDEVVDEPDDAPEVDETAADDVDEDEAAERRRTQPEPGSAAERAAARRARLREQRNGKNGDR